MKPLVTIIIGTRPEAIKLAPVIKAFNNSNQIETRVICSGQHKDLVKQVLKLFDISYEKSLDLMKKKQSLAFITTSVINGLEKEFKENQPQLVIVQGDTTTAFSAAITAFYNKIPVAHVEAGLRTNDIYDPFPEELNRRLISQIAAINFAPTQLSLSNLKGSNITGENKVTGNTVIDSLLYISGKNDQPLIKELKDKNSKKILFTTVHRRENWGLNLKNISAGLKRILNTYEDTIVFLPLHPNPIVRESFEASLGDHPRAILSEPLEYDQMVNVLKKSYLVLTDSGGLQEEAPSLGKPVLVLRKNTERIEGINSGTAKLIGTDTDNIFFEIEKLLTNKALYESMATAINPYGDGSSSKLILEKCLDFIFNKSNYNDE